MLGTPNGSGTVQGLCKLCGERKDDFPSGFPEFSRGDLTRHRTWMKRRNEAIYSTVDVTPIWKVN